MVYMFLAEGFEEIEALCPLDLMRRANIDVTTVGIGEQFVTGAHGITVQADIADVNFKEHAKKSEIELVFLPGGMPGTLNLAKSTIVTETVRYAFESKKYIAAICAAPSILGKLGFLRGKEAICYPGFEEQLIGATISDRRIVLDDKILTAAGMGVALDMGIEIIRLLCNDQKANDIRCAVIAD